MVEPKTLYVLVEKLVIVINLAYFIGVPQHNSEVSRLQQKLPLVETRKLILYQKLDLISRLYSYTFRVEADNQSGLI